MGSLCSADVAPVRSGRAVWSGGLVPVGCSVGQSGSGRSGTSRSGSSRSGTGRSSSAVGLVPVGPVPVGPVPVCVLFLYDGSASLFFMFSIVVRLDILNLLEGEYFSI